MYKLKKLLIKRGLKKHQRNSDFDIEVADRYFLTGKEEPGINDSHYFSFHSFNTLERIIYRSSRRSGNATNELWFIYRDKDGNIYLPVKDHFTQKEVHPCSVTCIDAGKTMKVEYKGKVIRGIESKDKEIVPDLKAKPIDCYMKAIFTAVSPVFEFSRDQDPEVLASCIAKEKDMNNVRNAFKQVYQIHYEQSGFSDIEITLDNKTTSIYKMVTMRDHSYGKRDWDFFDRYIWSMVLLENGDMLQTGWMQYPVVKELQSGCIIGKNKAVSGYKNTPMDNMPCTGTNADKLDFNCKYADKSVRNIKGDLDFKVATHFDGCFTVNIGVYKYDVDGIQGRGVCEFAYNTDKSRWKR